MIIFITAFATLAAITYVVFEATHRLHWTRFRPAHIVEGAGSTPFRRSHAMTTYWVTQRKRAPWRTRVIALWSIGSGQMAILRGLFTIVTIPLYGIGLLGIPGTLLSFRIWRDGVRLLRADRRALDDIPTTATFLMIRGGCVMSAAFMMYGAGGFELAAVVGAYALASFVHAACLALACRDLREVLDAQRRANAAHLLPPAARPTAA
jgi:hypothetical protein